MSLHQTVTDYISSSPTTNFKYLQFSIYIHFFQLQYFHVPTVYNVCTHREKIGKFCIKQIHNFGAVMTLKTKFSFQIIGHVYYWHFYIHYPGQFLQPGTHKTRQLSDNDIFQTVFILNQVHITPIWVAHLIRGVCHFGISPSVDHSGASRYTSLFSVVSVSNWDAEGPGYSIRRLHTPSTSLTGFWSRWQEVRICHNSCSDM